MHGISFATVDFFYDAGFLERSSQHELGELQWFLQADTAGTVSSDISLKKGFRRSIVQIDTERIGEHEFYGAKCILFPGLLPQGIGKGPVDRMPVDHIRIQLKFMPI